MGQNVLLAGQTFQGVEKLQLPSTTQGATVFFHDVSDTTAQPRDVTDGKIFYTAAGVRTMGTNSGGGGGGDEPVTAKAVNFYDVTGRICYSYTLNEFAGLTEMPVMPSHSWVTNQGWNMTLEQAQGVAAGAGSLAVTGAWKTADGAVDIQHSRITTGNYDLFNHNGTGVEWGNNFYTSSGGNFGYYTSYGSSDVDATLGDSPAMRIFRLPGGTTMHGMYVRTKDLITIPNDATTLHFIVRNDVPSIHSAMNYCVGILPQSAASPFKNGSTILLDAYVSGYAYSITDIQVDVSAYAGQQKYVIANAYQSSAYTSGTNFYITSAYFD